MDVQPLPDKLKVALACVLFGVLGALLGRVAAPETVRVEERVVEKFVSVDHTKKTVAKATYKKTTFTPDAGVVVEESTRELTDVDRVATNTTDRTSVTVTTPVEKYWRAGPKVGVMPLAPGAPALVVGAELGLTIPKTSLEIDAFGLVPVTAPDRFVVGGGVSLRW